MKLLLLGLCAVVTLAPAASALPSDRECVEGTTTVRDCNTCVCRNGVQQCTLEACLPEAILNRTGGIPSGAECSAGSRWKKECNWCTCSSNGVSLCDKRACIPGFEQDPNEPTCDEGSNWKIDTCNRCRCIDGKQACSKRLCAAVETPQATGGQDPGLDCQGEGRWRVNCNWCRCGQGRGLCSRRGCPPALAERLEGQPECEGQVSFKRDCNNCACANGKIICTTKFCGPVQSTPDTQVTVVRVGVHTRPADDKSECTNGSRWRKGCNWCSCNDRGIGMCTKKGCPPEVLEEQKNEPECEGTSRWKKGCNWCNCVDGRGICTLKACLPGSAPSSPGDTSVSHASDTVQPPDSEEVCTNGSRWRQECNWCMCSDRGLSMCTLQLCSPESLIEMKDEPECEGTSQWKKDCNWCHCLNGRGICTLQACETEPESDGEQAVTTRGSRRECSKGSRWKKGCNWCHCTKQGVGLCTKVGCPAGYEHPEGEPLCTDASRWKEDCKRCNCDKGVPSCAGKNCDNIRDIPATCIEGETFQQDCNTCQCNNGHVVCTEIACQQPSVVVPEPACSEGTSWSEDCNSCRCSNRMKLCTRKLCVAPSLPNHCRLPPISPGAPLCAGFERKWTFDSASSECKDIVYGGCGGTENLFDAEADCLASCTVSERSLSPSGGSSSGPNPSIRKALSESQKRCLLPMDQGPCFAALPRFFYNKETGNCESFTFGACKGNANRFQTAEECRETCGGVAPATDEACDRSLCPWNRWDHYMAKQCLPQYDGGACCPTSFSCPSRDKSPEERNQCFYKNKSYDVGARLDVDHACSADCYCSKHSQSRLAEISCASIECPDLFRPPQPGCRPLYRSVDCCAYSHDCSGQQAPTELESRSPTCLWKNQTFHEGGRMYFDEAPCQQCTCSGNFVDPFGPGCVKIDCGFEFRYTARYEEGCVPVFYKENCCPIDWLCPDDSRIIDSGQDISGATEVNACILDKDPGSCHNDVTRIYYDAEASECRQFVYGGCQGNDNNFRTFEECEESCSKTPRPSQSECQVGGLESAGPSEPQNVKVTAHLNSGYPGRMSLQVEWSAPKCPRGNIKGYQVWVQAISAIGKPHLDKNNASKFTGPLITQLVTGGLYSEQSYVIAVAAENNHAPSNISPLVVYSLIPNYHRPDQCHLGTISLEVGKSLTLSRCEIDCRCITPPELTCVQYQSCKTVKEQQSYKDCPQVTCAAECTPLTDTLTGCLTCSCQNKSFTCPDPECPALCSTTINYETGCPDCKCECPLDESGKPPCPEDCAVQQTRDPVTGCEVCKCDPNDTGNPFNPLIPPPPPPSILCFTDPDGRAPCPQDCAVIRTVDQSTGCEVCVCDSNDAGNPFNPLIPPPSSRCTTDPNGQAPCPQDCAVIQTVDQSTGCEVCKCDPNDTWNPFNPLIPPPRSNCFRDPDGRAPCPQDCAVIRTIEQSTGCEVCICDPNDTGNPFNPLIPPPSSRCTTDPNGRAPCPQDCAVIQTIDQSTGCEVCKCDPNDTGNPFNPLIPPPLPPRSNCFRDPDGRAPCPQDCAVIRIIEQSTGCEVCICDPNDTGNPFNPLIPPPSSRCTTDPSGRAPCPQDCAVIHTVDQSTGCEVCVCDPNDTGNPFNPLIPPPRSNCFRDPDGRAPCPQDCAVIRTIEQSTGCEVCICDPNNPGNPFLPPPREPCPKDHNGRAHCPEDCGIIRRVDQNTGCEVCECDPNDTGGPEDWV